MAERILILGGTGILGPVISKALLNKGYFVYLFNRCRNPERMINGVHLIQGDRQSVEDIEQLKDLNIDYVIDTIGWFPETLPYIINNILKSVKRYIFISSVAVDRKSTRLNSSH